MSKITLNMSLTDCVVELSEGNPGAVTALMEAMTCERALNGPMGAFYPLLGLDGWEIYGSDIYVLWNDICDRDADKMVSIVELTQRGDIDYLTLKDACSRQDYSGKDMINIP